MAAFFELYPVVSLLLVLAVVAALTMVVWGAVDGRRRDREAVRPAVLDELLRHGQHRR